MIGRFAIDVMDLNILVPCPADASESVLIILNVVTRRVAVSWIGWLDFTLSETVGPVH